MHQPSPRSLDPTRSTCPNTLDPACSTWSVHPTRGLVSGSNLVDPQSTRPVRQPSRLGQSNPVGLGSGSNAVRPIQCANPVDLVGGSNPVDLVSGSNPVNLASGPNPFVKCANPVDLVSIRPIRPGQWIQPVKSPQCPGEWIQPSRPVANPVDLASGSKPVDLVRGPNPVDAFSAPPQSTWSLDPT